MLACQTMARWTRWQLREISGDTQTMPLLVFIPLKQIHSLLENGLMSLINTSYHIKVQRVLTMHNQVTSLSYPACILCLCSFTL